MATYELKRFAQVHILKSIKPEHLAEFFAPYGEYFAGVCPLEGTSPPRRARVQDLLVPNRSAS